MTVVWLARHGEVHNPRNVLYGRLPRMRLTPEGQRQAAALAEFLAARPIEAVYSSPMLRARRTAAAIVLRQAQDERKGQLRVRIDRDLLEVNTAWQGEPLADLERINWDFYGNPRGANDESLQAIHDRMQRWLARVLRRHASGEVVGVGHGDPILILVGSLSGRPLDRAVIFPQPYIEPGTVFRMRFNPDSKLRDIERFVPHAEKAA